MQTEDRDGVITFLRLFQQLDPTGRLYICNLVYRAVVQQEPTVLDMLDRHAAGERVSNLYLNLRTGVRVRVEPGTPVPGHHVPVITDLDRRARPFSPPRVVVLPPPRYRHIARRTLAIIARMPHLMMGALRRRTSTNP